MLICGFPVVFQPHAVFDENSNGRLATAPLLAVQRDLCLGNIIPVMLQSGPRSDPHLEYSTRLNDRRKTVQRYEGLDLRIAQGRLATAVVFVLAIWLSLSREVLSPWWLLG